MVLNSRSISKGKEVEALRRGKSLSEWRPPKIKLCWGYA